jgi:hypothetical protein
VTLQDLGSLGEFVAAIATLIYLALQIRQNTRESQAASRNLVSQSFVDFCFHVSGDLEIAKLTRRGLIDPESLDDDETLLSGMRPLLPCLEGSQGERAS